MRVDSHRLAEIRSLALHREVARRLREEPRLLGPVERRVDDWIETGQVSAYYANAWKELLEGPRGAFRPLEVRRQSRQRPPLCEGVRQARDGAARARAAAPGGHGTAGLTPAAHLEALIAADFAAPA